MNNFVANTADFFNSFSETIEKKISKVSNKVTELETLLAVLEAKLNSIPGLEGVPPVIDSAPPPSSSVPHSAQPEAQSVSGAAPPSSAPAETSTTEISTEVVASGYGDSSMIPILQHPDYEAYFKLLRVGVPGPVVQAKIVAAGLDGSVIDNPDQLVPAP